MRKIVYVDMDNVLVDFPSGIAKLDDSTRQKFADDLDEVPGIFSLMDPMEGAIAGFNSLAKKYDTYILSTAPWENPSAWSDKLLNRGDYLIDDRNKNGAGEFQGELIRFGSEEFPDWDAVTRYLLP